MNRFHFILLVSIAILFSGCSGQHVLPASAGESAATSRVIDSDRILVTVDAIAHRNAAALSPSGRLDYAPPSPAAIRKEQLRRAQQLADRHDLQLEEDWPIPALGVHCFVFRLNEPARKSGVLARLAADDNIDSAQPLNFFHGASDSSMTTAPDPLSAWNEELNQRLRDAHRHSTGKTVTIAVVDTGIDLEHEDLQSSRIVTHDFVDGLRTPPAEMHGTAVTGLLAARTENDVGIRGYTPDADIMLLRACWETEQESERAVCNSFTLAKALSFALSSNAAVINLSISGPRDPLLERIAAKFVDNNQLVVAAGDSRDRFPASVPHSIAAAGGATTSENDAVLTLLPGNRYGMRGGTSMAAARVSGIAALMKQLDPTLSVEQFRQLLALPLEPATGRLMPVRQLLQHAGSREQYSGN